MLVQIALFDDFDLLDALAPYEVLFAGGVAAGGGLRVELAAQDGPREVRSGPTGLPIGATAALDPDRADIIVVPGAAAPAMDAIPGCNEPSTAACRPSWSPPWREPGRPLRRSAAVR